MASEVTDLTLTQTGDTAIGTLEWDHDGIDLDRFMLGYSLDGTTWTNLEPRPAGDFGAGPYEASVAVGEDLTWRVLALETDGTIS